VQFFVHDSVGVITRNNGEGMSCQKDISSRNHKFVAVAWYRSRQPG